MGYKKRSFGTTKDNKEAYIYTFENKNGMKAEISDLGAIIVSVFVPGKDGRLRDVVLGYDSVSEYEGESLFFGAAVGRNANRISGPEFKINDRVYKLKETGKGINLHSGPDHYRTRVWDTKEVSDNFIKLSLFSPDGDQGFPGNADICVTYELTDENEIRISYEAVSDADTVFNLTNHSYFNLNGCRPQLCGKDMSIEGHEAVIYADAFTVTDERSIPTGEIRPVKGTPMDFTKPKTIGRDINEDYDQLKMAEGYDHNWAVNGEGFRKAAALRSEESGIGLEVYTDLPGVQFYTGNYIDGRRGKGGLIYPARSGVCFETQFFPDAVNHENFKSPVVRAGEAYKTATIFKFINF